MILISRLPEPSMARPDPRAFFCATGLALSALFPAQAFAAKVTQSAEEVAAQARQGLECPAPALPRAAGRPVDDVLGVRPGMSYEQAQRAVLCTDRLLVAAPETRGGYRVPSYGQKLRQGFTAEPAQPRIERSGREWMKEMQDRNTARGTNRAGDPVAPGQSHWWVVTMGLPGQEQALVVQREEFFAQEQRPSMAAVESTLTAKFGAPHRRDVSPSGYLLRWGYDPANRPSRRDDCLFGTRMGSVPNPQPACGLSISIWVIPMRENPGMARSMTITVMDQALAARTLDTTEAALRQAEEQRRKQEVEKAGNGPKPRI